MRFLDEMKLAQKPTGPILAFVVVFVGYLIAGLVPAAFGLNGENTSTYMGQFIMTASFAIWIAVIFAWVFFKEKRSIASIGFGGDALKQTIIGAVAGVALTSVVVGVSLATGQARLGTPQWSLFVPSLLLLVGFAIQASAEEIAYRGYMSQAFGTKLSVALVVVLQAVIFTLGHIGNGLNPIAIVTMLSVSYFLMMWIFATGNLWGAMAFHTFWNWSQANFWGAAVSNFHMDTHVFSFTSTGNALLTGGSFGLEGSLLTIAMLIAGGIYFQLKWQKSQA